MVQFETGGLYRYNKPRNWQFALNEFVMCIEIAMDEDCNYVFTILYRRGVAKIRHFSVAFSAFDEAEL